MNVRFNFLAGYMKKISKKLVNRFKNKIMNIHPSLLPLYGGKGFYGMKVHEAVFANKDKKQEQQFILLMKIMIQVQF